jgi:hypothetical protein
MPDEFRPISVFPLPNACGCLRIDGKFFDVTDRAGEECHRITVFLLWIVMLAARLGLERPSGLYGQRDDEPGSVRSRVERQ